MISESKQTEISPPTDGLKESNETAVLSAIRGRSKTMTKKEALATIAAIKEENKTYYFDGSIDIEDMKDLFRNDGFAERETNLIVAALVAAGCVFRDAKDNGREGENA